MSSSARKHTVPAIAPHGASDVHGGLLDTAEPYAGQGVRVPDEVMFGARPRDGFVPTPQGEIGRSIGVNLAAQSDPMRLRNRELLIELSTVVGHEGDDFQNPYAWTATGVLVYPSEHSTELATGIGGYGLGQTPADVALNVRSTAHALLV